MHELTDAGVDFTLIGQQMYIPYRDLQDIIVYLERFEVFKRPLHIPEVGAPGGPGAARTKTEETQCIRRNPTLAPSLGRGTAGRLDRGHVHPCLQ